MSAWIFEPAGASYVPSAHARGPWDPKAQHGGAPAALLAREIERVAPGEDMLVARITFEFLGPVPLLPLEADAWIQRPGARFQIIEAELRQQGRAVVRARAVRLRRGDVALPGTALGATVQRWWIYVISDGKIRRAQACATRADALATPTAG